MGGINIKIVSPTQENINRKRKEKQQEKEKRKTDKIVSKVGVDRLLRRQQSISQIGLSPIVMHDE